MTFISRLLTCLFLFLCAGEFGIEGFDHAPRRDFGTAETAHFVRFSTANSMAELRTAIERLNAWLNP